MRIDEVSRTVTAEISGSLLLIDFTSMWPGNPALIPAAGCGISNRSDRRRRFTAISPRQTRGPQRGALGYLVFGPVGLTGTL
jgi:hypothetical protein